MTRIAKLPPNAIAFRESRFSARPEGGILSIVDGGKAIFIPDHVVISRTRWLVYWREPFVGHNPGSLRANANVYGSGSRCACDLARLVRLWWRRGVRSGSGVRLASARYPSQERVGDHDRIQMTVHVWYNCKELIWAQRVALRVRSSSRGIGSCLIDVTAVNSLAVSPNLGASRGYVVLRHSMAMRWEDDLKVQPLLTREVRIGY